MTDEELQAWHLRHRDHKNPQTFMAHLRIAPVAKEKTSSKPKVDTSEFV